jgi:hypothetical protein
MQVVAAQSLNRERKRAIYATTGWLPRCPLHRPARGGLRSNDGSRTAGGDRREKGEERVSENCRE